MANGLQRYDGRGILNTQAIDASCLDENLAEEMPMLHYCARNVTAAINQCPLNNIMAIYDDRGCRQ